MIKFRDLNRRIGDARSDLEYRQKRLQEIKAPTKAEDEERARMETLLALSAAKADVNLDPLFVAVAHLCETKETAGLKNKKLKLENGALKIVRGERVEDLDDSKKALVALVNGLLAVDGCEAPPLVVENDNVKVKEDHPAYVHFVGHFYDAVRDVETWGDLPRLVLGELEKIGLKGGPQGDSEVDTQEFARVMRLLAEERVTEKTAQLCRHVAKSLDKLQKAQFEPEVPDMLVELPDLDAVTEYQIQSKNVEAIGPMIFAAMLDELKAFQVVDKLADLWQRGMLPIGYGPAGEKLYQHWKNAATRMSDAERQNFYAATMGLPGGSANGAANREFNDLWIRFVSSVSTLMRQRTVDSLLRANVPSSITQQHVRKSARDLALNLSLHGYGIVNYAARDLLDQINEMIALLKDPDILAANGAKDMWQVIDQVATLELGGARNSARYRTLATCGAIITKWLSQNIERFNSGASFEPVIDVDKALYPTPHAPGESATSKPSDFDLVNACELWLADTAVSEERVDELSQPRESPAMTSLPVPIPALARDVLESLPTGVGLGLSAPRR